MTSSVQNDPTTSHHIITDNHVTHHASKK